MKKAILILFVMLISTIKMVAQITENPIVEEAKQKHAYITAVIVSSERTVIAVDVSEWLSGWGHWVSLSQNTYIEYMDPTIGNIATQRITRLENLNGSILGFKSRYYNLPSGVLVMVFPALPRNVKKINLIEKSGFKWYRININPRADVEVPRIVTNEEQTTNLINNSSDDAAGIYEELSTKETSPIAYRLALVETTDYIYLLYIGKDYEKWRYGDVKATLHKTANDNIYKADWYLLGKIPSSAYVIKDGNNLKIHIDSNNQDITLVKMSGKTSNSIKEENVKSETFSNVYVVKKEGETWGPNENKYEKLGENGIELINKEMYSLAVNCFEQMLTIKCKNANRLKDYYSLVYCYTRLDELDKTIEAGKKYLELTNKNNDKNIHQVYSSMGLAYAEKKDWKNGALCFEAAIVTDSPNDLPTLVKDYYMTGRCYWSLKNDLLAQTNYKKAIKNGLKYYGITIHQIAKYGGNYDLLGEVFYYYAMLESDSYKNWNDLLYLAIRCGHKEAMEKHSELLEIYKESEFNPNDDLFN